MYNNITKPFGSFMKTFRFYFSSKATKTYDLITIGPYANHLHQIMSKKGFSKNLKKLSIEDTDHVVEPSLFFKKQEIILWKTMHYALNTKVDKVIIATNTNIYITLIKKV